MIMMMMMMINMQVSCVADAGYAQRTNLTRGRDPVVHFCVHDHSRQSANSHPPSDHSTELSRRQQVASHLYVTSIN